MVLLALAGMLAPTHAADLDLSGHFEQGGLVRGKAPPGSHVVFEGRTMRVAPDGTFLIGFGRNAPATARLQVQFPDGRNETRTLAVAPRQWDIQRIDGLPERKVTPSPEDLARIKADIAAIAAARAHDSDEVGFETRLIWPVTGPISGIYGSQRILNGQPRQPHFGIDIAAPAGTPVVAAAAGVVAVAHQDMFFTGKTVLIDHGYGLNSAYSHLSEITVHPGERVAQGAMIGRVGATGRVTGAHLDWRVNLFDIRLDPALLVPPMPAH